MNITTAGVDLAKQVFQVHGVDGRGNIPSFIHILDGRLHDVHALDLLTPEAGAICE